jgi:hypothetical protein
MTRKQIEEMHKQIDKLTYRCWKKVPKKSPLARSVQEEEEEEVGRSGGLRSPNLRWKADAKHSRRIAAQHVEEAAAAAATP